MMATGADHYAEAERQLDIAARASDRGQKDDAAFWLGAAQAHAVLSLAAATALGSEGGDSRLPAKDRAAWFDVASEHRKGQAA